MITLWSIFECFGEFYWTQPFPGKSSNVRCSIYIVRMSQWTIWYVNRFIGFTLSFLSTSVECKTWRSVTSQIITNARSTKQKTTLWTILLIKMSLVFYSFEWNVGSRTLLNSQQHSLYHKSKYKGEKRKCGLQPMTQSLLFTLFLFLSSDKYDMCSTSILYE